MSEEINDIVQIIRITCDGMEIAVRTGNVSVALVKKAARLITGMLVHEKTTGKTNLKKLLEKGGDLQVLSFAGSDMKKFKKFAKKYRILYSLMPGSEKNSGFTEVMFHSEAATRMGIVCQKLSGSRISSLGGFLEEDSISNNENFVDITISKKMVAEENSHAVKTRIPGTYGENAAYIWIGRENLMEVHGGRTLLACLDKNREYKIYSGDNSIIRTMQGEQLYRGHYAEVEKAADTAYKKAGKSFRKETAPKAKKTSIKQTGR